MHPPPENDRIHAEACMDTQLRVIKETNMNTLTTISSLPSSSMIHPPLRPLAGFAFGFTTTYMHACQHVLLCTAHWTRRRDNLLIDPSTGAMSVYLNFHAHDMYYHASCNIYIYTCSARSIAVRTMHAPPNTRYIYLYLCISCQ